MPEESPYQNPGLRADGPPLGECCGELSVGDYSREVPVHVNLTRNTTRAAGLGASVARLDRLGLLIPPYCPQTSEP